MNNWINKWRGMRAFGKLPIEQKQFVFYAEDQGSLPHLGPVVEALANKGANGTVYLSSGQTDPWLKEPPKGVKSFYIGKGLSRTLCFAMMKAKQVIMTMPDLETLEIKRSTAHPVKYTYIFHSVVSSHMIYRRDAFDHFDTVFCAGPHHEKEILAAEAAYGLRRKKLFSHGYARLDHLLSLERSESTQTDVVLFAPTWAEQGLMERQGVQIVKSLRNSGLKVIVRPHPRNSKKVITKLKREFKSDPKVEYDEQMSATQSLVRAAAMVSDWSGAAFEFALGLSKPVLFVDGPPKVRNADYQKLNCEPVEISMREQLGGILSEAKVSEIGDSVKTLLNKNEKFGEKIREARDRFIYNVGSSAEVAATELIRQQGEP